MNIYSLCLGIACACLLLGEDAFADVSGLVRVIDGDTIEVSDHRVRLHGIDAPELKQICKRDSDDWQCGLDATRALSDKLEGNFVWCEEKDRDRYRRIVAKCFFDDIDINEWLVLNGWAVSHNYYSDDYYSAEIFAKSKRNGIWASKFVMPWHWRRGHR